MTTNANLVRTTEMQYDAAGNKTLMKFPDQKTQQWLYGTQEIGGRI